MCKNCNHIDVNSKYDPTRTTTLRNLFANEMTRRFKSLESSIYNKIAVEDFFGLGNQVGVNAAPYNFPRSAKKVQEFMEWLQKQVDQGILSITEYDQLGSAIDNAWTNKYIIDSYKRGVIRARMELQKAGYDVPDMEATGGILASMNLPLHLDRLGLLYTRVFTDLKGITDTMSTQISRILAQGIADGDGPVALAKKLVAVINGSGMGDLSLTDSLGRFIPARRRAETLARTEIIRAHHQAMIQEYMNWGEIEIYVLAEVVTAGDDRVCDRCNELALGGPYTLEEAMNLIPDHPNCRCIALPFQKGVDTKITK